MCAMEIDGEEEEEVEFSEKIEACSIIRTDKNTYKVECSKTIWERHPFEMWEAEFFSDVDEETVARFKAESDREIVEHAIKVAKKYDVPVTVDLSTGRVILDKFHDKFQATSAVSLTEDKCVETLRNAGVKGEILAWSHEDKAFCVPEEVMREHQDRYDLFDSYITDHPLLKAYLASRYKRVKGETLEYKTDRRASFKGMLDDETLWITINPVWIVEQLVLVYGKLEDEDEVVKELIKTGIHEMVHYIDKINLEPYKGGWWEGLAAILGEPSPTGSEKKAEDIAKEAFELLAKADPKVFEAAKYEINRWSDEVDLEEAERLGEMIEENKELEIFWGGTVNTDARDEKVCVSLGVGDLSDEEASKIIEKLAEKYDLEYTDRIYRGWFPYGFSGVCVNVPGLSEVWYDNNPVEEEWW